MSVPIYVADAFIVNGKPFTGNAAGVCLLEYDDDISDETKQAIASEMNLSETAFVSHGWTKGNKLTTAPDSQIERRTLRWFTPATEVPLCGHATVASAKVIYSVDFRGKGDKTISFESKFRGKLGATICGADESITLNFPSNPTHLLNPIENPWINELIEKTLGNKFPNPTALKDVQYSPGTKIVLLRLNDELTERGLSYVSPDFKGLMGVKTGDFVRDIIVTVKGSQGKPDFYSRFFAPWDGIDEDPVTGLAHTVLTPYWTRELSLERGQVGKLFARQHSTRGGDLECTLLGDRVSIAGQARIGLKGELFL